MYLQQSSDRMTYHNVMLMKVSYVLTLAPTGVRATLVPTGGGRITTPGDLENEAS